MLILNTLPKYGQPVAAADAAYLDAAAADEMAALLRLCPRQQATRLWPLPSLAERLGIAAITVKDEGTRLGLGSFKALGGAHAVLRVVWAHAAATLGRNVAAEDLLGEEVRALAADLTVTCATDGNHGRSVAAAARLLGCRALIVVHEGVSAARVAAIAALGAQVVRVPGNYDDAVEESRRLGDKDGHVLVSDTSWPGYERIPALVMQGYTAIAREVLQDLPAPPTHVFLQAGVGGFAAALAGHFALVLGASRPKVVVVEPERAACLYASCLAGHAVKIKADAPTRMAMLECYEPSLLAWRVLSRVADAFMTVTESGAISAMRVLAYPERDEPSITAGESGAAGLAGLLRVAGDSSVRARVGLDAQSRVLLINTETATDPASYFALTGRDGLAECPFRSDVHRAGA